MKYYIFLISLLFSLPAYAQEGEGRLQFKLTLDEQALEIGKKYYSRTIADTVQFETIRFYISNMQFYQGEQLVHALEKKYLLLDAEDAKSLNITWPYAGDFNMVKFNIGVDSLTSVSGAFGGDLDPANGMYWTWQSGYVNVKLEGITKICPARHHRFQYHIGGYQYPYNTLQKVELKIADDKALKIEIAIDQLFAQINLKETYQVMSPNEQAIKMAQLFAAIFSVQE